MFPRPDQAGDPAGSSRLAPSLIVIRLGGLKPSPLGEGFSVASRSKGPMDEYRHGSHTVFEIHLHLVWVTKYRKPILVGPVGERAPELIREICGPGRPRS